MTGGSRCNNRVDVSALVAILVIGMVVFAMTTLLGSVLVSRRLRRASGLLATTAQRLDERSSTMPDTLATARGRIAGLRTDAERALWSLTLFDAGLERTEAKLIAGRTALDALEERLADNRTRIGRLRDTARLALRALEMRRTFLG